MDLNLPAPRGMRIRASTERDKAALAALHRRAFGAAEGAAVAGLALALLDDASARPLLSLVAELGGEIAGHALFSAAGIGAGEAGNARILAPLAVQPEQQRRGMGGALIRHGLTQLRTAGARLALVYGDPGYYSRHGFRAGHAIAPAFKLTCPAAWLALELQAGALAGARGKVRCAGPLNDPGHW